MTNRFEQVDEAVEDAITLSLEQRSDGQWARVLCPRSAVQGRLPKDYVSKDLPPTKALATAVKLANDLKVAMVVVDRDAIWKKEWGALYRWEAEP
jgi:hypothetical protein